MSALAFPVLLVSALVSALAFPVLLVSALVSALAFPVLLVSGFPCLAGICFGVCFGFPCLAGIWLSLSCWYLQTMLRSANHAPFITRALRKAIVLRSRLRNRHNKSRTAENWNSFRKQRNRCVKFFRQAKKDYYSKLDINLVTDNRKFWKTVKPALSDKCQSNNKIVLVKDDEIISDDIEIAEIFNRFFVTVTESLGIKENNDTYFQALRAYQILSKSRYKNTLIIPAY